MFGIDLGTKQKNDSANLQATPVGGLKTLCFGREFFNYSHSSTESEEKSILQTACIIITVEVVS
jgi:hypothetical protein